ncbi:hypothetical protein IHE45_01G032000 [Dioscorea alata]|uniref:Uncharacterized protein n=1 Tax=Dioscorea alata TaxID=55571 RepID=A0ACB7WT06_DIOAL|nr:hypothetical protein IHE45_01G032000 [Dioscorea alata]
MQFLPISRSCRQARSSTPRRPRTKGSLAEFSNCRCDSSSIRTAVINQGNDNSVSELSREMCVSAHSESTTSGSRKDKGIVRKPIVTPAFQTESVIPNVLTNTCDNRERHPDVNGVNTGSNSEQLGLMADKSMSKSSGSPDELRHLIQQEQSDDMFNITSSSRTKDECVDEGRGKRKRKLKVHFDELNFPEKSVRRIRRIKIMRYLGLVAPAGSPYSVAHASSP